MDTRRAARYGPVADTLLDSLSVVHQLMRIAYEAEQHWLVEKLETERESLARKPWLLSGGIRVVTGASGEYSDAVRQYH